MMLRLKQARKMKGESLRQSAKGLGMSHEGLNKYEKGRIKCDSQMLIKFSKYYGVTTDYLIENKSRPKVELKNVKFHKIKFY